jgi:uncharacterized membrane protein
MVAMIKRFFRHLWCVYWQAPRIFPQRIRNLLGDAIRRAEIGHAGEICLVIEASLTPWQLWRGVSAHERAIEVFSRLRVWDTEHNSGLLIYLLLADRAVEIVADRGLCEKEISRAWTDLLDALRGALAAGKFEAGCLNAIDTAGQLMRRHFPTNDSGANEFPNDVEWL